MRILFAAATPHLPDATGGAQVSIDAMARALQVRGHQVMVLAAASAEGRPAQQSISSQQTFAVLPYDGLGYPLARAEQPVEALPAILAGWRPDIVSMSFGSGELAAMAVTCLRNDVPVMLTVRNVELGNASTVLPDHPLLGRLANSAFTARRMASLFGTDLPVIPPLIDPAACVFDPRHRGEGDRILLVNPVIGKGVDIFFRLAASRPDLPFLAVESWHTAPDWRAMLLSRAAALGNVEIMHATRDMCAVYQRARVVLMPSIYEETWGRVVTEAQLNGIPVIASDRGALPETTGAGGLVVPVDQGIGPWIDALNRLIDDGAAYRRVSAAALAQAARPTQSAETVATRFIALLQAHIATAREAASSPASPAELHPPV